MPAGDETKKTRLLGVRRHLIPVGCMFNLIGDLHVLGIVPAFTGSDSRQIYPIIPMKAFGKLCKSSHIVNAHRKIVLKGNLKVTLSLSKIIIFCKWLCCGISYNFNFSVSIRAPS